MTRKLPVYGALKLYFLIWMWYNKISITMFPED